MSAVRLTKIRMLPKSSFQLLTVLTSSISIADEIAVQPFSEELGGLSSWSGDEVLVQRTYRWRRVIGHRLFFLAPSTVLYTDMLQDGVSC